jgi:hypothetical protein
VENVLQKRDTGHRTLLTVHRRGSSDEVPRGSCAGFRSSFYVMGKIFYSKIGDFAHAPSLADAYSFRNSFLACGKLSLVPVLLNGERERRTGTKLLTVFLQHIYVEVNGPKGVP